MLQTADKHHRLIIIIHRQTLMFRYLSSSSCSNQRHIMVRIIQPNANTKQATKQVAFSVSMGETSQLTNPSGYK